MREEQLRMAARAVVDVLDVLDPRSPQLRVGDRAQVEHATIGDALVPGEGLEHLLADLVAAAADTWSDGRGDQRRISRVRLHSRRRLRDQPAGEAAPSA